MFIVLDLSVYHYLYEAGTETRLLRTCLEDQLTQSGCSVNGRKQQCYFRAILAVSASSGYNFKVQSWGINCLMMQAGG